LPVAADTLALYIDEMSDSLKSVTIRRRINNLGSICFLAGIHNPVREPAVKIALKRMHRKIGRAQHQAYPLTREYLNQMIKKCPKRTLIGLRNRLLLLMGYETMRRRAELVAFLLEDLRKFPNGRFALFMRRSKTDQMGDGRVIPISDELADLIQLWSKRIGQTTGPILRSVNKSDCVSDKPLPASSVPVLLVDLQYRARLRHLPDFSGHSFRVGGALDMLKNGVPLAEIMLRGGWTRESTTLRYLQSWASHENPMETLPYSDLPGDAVLKRVDVFVYRQLRSVIE
jgi:integrase